MSTTSRDAVTDVGTTIHELEQSLAERVRTSLSTSRWLSRCEKYNRIRETLFTAAREGAGRG